MTVLHSAMSLFPFNHINPLVYFALPANTSVLLFYRNSSFTTYIEANKNSEISPSLMI